MEYYLPDELELIGWRHRTNSMQPEKNSFLGRGRTCVWPLFLLQEDRTSRPTGHKYSTRIVWWRFIAEGGGHILRTTRCCCAVACAKRYRSYSFAWQGPRFWMDPNTFFYLGAERMTMSNLVPFLPVPQGRIGWRHALSYSVSADWNSKPGPLCSFMKNKPLS